MADNWDDSDDEWDKSDDELEKRLGLAKVDDSPPAFEDEDEDLTLKEKELDERAALKVNKAKGSALADKKAAELAAKEELELARKAMEMEAEMEANMTPEERRQRAREREEDDARAMADDLFGGVDDPGSRGPGGGAAGAPGQAMMSGDKVVMKDLKDHLRHAKKVGECIQVRFFTLRVCAIYGEKSSDCWLGDSPQSCFNSTSSEFLCMRKITIGSYDTTYDCDGIRVMEKSISVRHF
jgi:translation initiation factor 3 subunit J